MGQLFRFEALDVEVAVLYNYLCRMEIKCNVTSIVPRYNSHQGGNADVYKQACSKFTLGQMFLVDLVSFENLVGLLRANAR